MFPPQHQKHHSWSCWMASVEFLLTYAVTQIFFDKIVHYTRNLPVWHIWQYKVGSSWLVIEIKSSWDTYVIVKGCFFHLITFSRMRSRGRQANLACLLPVYPTSECQQRVHNPHSCCVALGFAGEEALEMFFLGKINSVLKWRGKFHCSKQWYVGGEYI